MRHDFEIIDGCRIAVHDNGGKTIDRYTVVFFDVPEPQVAGGGYRLTGHHFSCLGMSGEPFHPQGFGQHSTAMPGNHLGKRIEFYSLPADCQKCVQQDLKAIQDSFCKID